MTDRGRCAVASRFDGFVDNGADYTHELEDAVKREVVAHRQHRYGKVHLLRGAGVDLASLVQSDEKLDNKGAGRF